MPDSAIAELARHGASVTVQHNPHKRTGEGTEQYLRSRFAWVAGSIENHVTAQDMQDMASTDTIWTIRWYPNEPGGFRSVYASTFERALQLAEQGAEPPPENTETPACDHGSQSRSG